MIVWYAHIIGAWEVQQRRVVPILLIDGLLCHLPGPRVILKRQDAPQNGESGATPATRQNLLLLQVRIASS